MRSPALALSRRVVASIAALLFVLASMVAAHPAHAADAGDVSWTVRTASNQLGADRTSFTYSVNPGASVSDGLVIANRGAEPVELAVYGADGFTTDSGQFDVLVAGEKSVGIGAWVHVEAERVSVPAGKTVTVPFTLTIPQNATPGDHAGGVVTSLSAPDDTAGVNVDRRLGIRMNVRVAGDLRPSLAVDDVHVAWGGGLVPFATGDAVVTYTIRNAGNTALSAQQAATVAGPFGWFPRAAQGVKQAPPLLPGETWRQSVRVPAVAALFLLTATAEVTPVVTDASGSTSPLAPVVATGTGWAVPWAVLVILILVALLAVLVPRGLRRRRAAAQAREDARVQDAVAQALEQKDAAAEPVGSGTVR